MMRSLKAALILLLFTACDAGLWAQVSRGVADACSAPLLVFGGSGQSNQVGTNTDTPPSINSSIAPRLLMLDNAWVWCQASEPLDSATNQLDTVSSDSTTNTGPGIYFMERLAEVLTASIAWVPCGRGNLASLYFAPLPREQDSMGTWWGNAVTPYSNYKRSQMYGSCTARLQHVVAKYGATYGGNLHAQGENNARLSGTVWPQSQEHAERWDEHTQAQFDEWRLDLATPEAVMVYTQLPSNAPSGTWAWWGDVRNSQASIERDDQPMVTTTRAGTNVHFTAAEQKTIGRDAADAWLDANGCE